MKETKTTLSKSVVLMSTVFNFSLVFLSMCTCIYENECESLSFQLMWSVEEMHVGHKISIRKMSNRLSNQ